MRKLLLTVLFTLLASGLFAQGEKSWYPAYFSKDYVVVAVNAHTTDEELLQIRKNIQKYSMIRFTNFDVIRAAAGSIYFLSMEVDCRAGYSGKISHAFEPGDMTYYGFVRDYSLNTYKKPFFIGNLLSPYSGINHVEEYIATKQEEDKRE